jgi:hypothetical protein
MKTICQEEILNFTPNIARLNKELVILKIQDILMINQIFLIGSILTILVILYLGTMDCLVIDG